MTAPSIERWRGLVALTEDAVVGASRAVERVHLETAQRPFAVLERIPLVNLPAAVVRVIHDATVSSVHGLIRLSAHAVGATLVAVLDAGGRAAAAGQSHQESAQGTPAPDHDLTPETSRRRA